MQRKKPHHQPLTRGRVRSTYRIVLCAMLCALDVVILAVGMMFDLMDASAAVVASLLLLPVLWQYGRGYAMLCWGVTSAVGLILMPHSTVPWLFLCLFGYYPVVKQSIDRLVRPLAYLVKFLLVSFVLGIYMLLTWCILLGGEGSILDALVGTTGAEAQNVTVGMAVVMVGLCLFIFFMFDLLIDKLYIIYRHKWHARVEKWFK